ncbi:MAG TPA: nucleotidyltransferase family protein [Burkholderiaceae bacterium]|nr:nucleotidyltransferase family protein [Burkholderiaceae bacterium]
MADGRQPITQTNPLAVRFIDQALQNPHNHAILQRLPSLQLPDAWLVAGCLFQTVWNLQAGRDPTAGIKDYDLFYFDGADLTEQAEAAIGQRVDACFRDLGVTIEAKNQARVHTWYPEWFGMPYAALHSSREGIARFLVPCTCVGLQPAAAATAPHLYAPYGLDELYCGILRPNPLMDHRELFRQKAASYRDRWHWLQIRED